MSSLHHGKYHNLQEIQLGQLALCEQVHLNHHRKLKFLVTRQSDEYGDRRLYRMYLEADCPQTIAPVKTLSLARMLRGMGSEPEHTDRLFQISYVLALTIWQYCNTKWMSAVWRPSDFYFVDEHNYDSGNSPAIRSYPYISIKKWSLDREATAASDDYSGMSLAARYPALMSLGMLLIDVGLGTHEAAWDECSSKDDICLRAHRILSANRGRWPLKDLEGIASSCFNNRLFVNLADSLGSESLRSLIFKEIVRPLEVIYRASTGEELQLQCKRSIYPQSAEDSIEDAAAEETRRRIKHGSLLADGGGSNL